MTAIAAAAAEPEAATAQARTTRQRLTWTHAWAPGLVSIRVTRDPSFRFTPGHYARAGIAKPDGAMVFRPLSVASAPSDRELEFFCTLVPGGEFSGCLAGLRVGGDVEIEKASFGFLTIDSLAPGDELWLLATGTGLAPYMSMLRDRGIWQGFERIVVAHSVRYAAELAYADEMRGLAAHAPLRYLPIVTRERAACALAERIPALLASGRLAEAGGVALDPATSRVMVCGNPEMTRELRASFGERGFRTTRRGVRGQIAFEKYW